MVYLDYSATTPVDSEVLESYVKATNDFIGNPNSLHKLGVLSKQLEESATAQIKNILSLTESEVIYTSCASESNNLAIKGVALRNQKRGKHIITTNLEHSSIYGPLGYLQKLGFDITFVNANDKGLIEIEELKKIVRDDTILVSIASVNSEVGIRQNIEDIALFLKNYPNCYFHVDATQSIGKVQVDFKNVDLISFTAHKFYGPKGIGCLIKKKDVLMDPLIHGGKSTTVYRSGTPALPLIVSLSKALRLIDRKEEEYLIKVKELNNYLKNKLSNYNNITINSNEYSIPHILNISILNIKPETMQHALEEDDIYISTQSACSANNSLSKAVFEVTKNDMASRHSIRISLSGLTTKEEIDFFLESFDKWYKKLSIKG